MPILLFYVVNGALLKLLGLAAVDVPRRPAVRPNMSRPTTPIAFWAISFIPSFTWNLGESLVLLTISCFYSHLR